MRSTTPYESRARTLDEQSPAESNPSLTPGLDHAEPKLGSPAKGRQYKLLHNPYCRYRAVDCGQRHCSDDCSCFCTGRATSAQVCSSSRPRWERIPPKNCFYYRSPKTNNAYVLSFVFVFDREHDKYAFAYSYPFTYTHQQRLLAEVRAVEGGGGGRL